MDTGTTSISGTGERVETTVAFVGSCSRVQSSWNDLLLPPSLPGQGWSAVRACSYGNGETPSPRGPIGYSPSDARMQRLHVERYMSVCVRVYLWAWVHASVYLYMFVSVCPCT